MGKVGQGSEQKMLKQKGNKLLNHYARVKV